MNPIPFSASDLTTPQGIERTLRLFESYIIGLQKPEPAPELDFNALIKQVRDSLQATGSTPLNLQSLLPSGLGNAAILVDTHANRLTQYPATNYPVGTVFFETDRTVLYTVINLSGVLTWKYSAGMYSSSFATRATDLTSTGDVGFLMWVSLYNHIMKWGGAAWAFVDTQGGQIGDFVVDPGLGWILCDGTPTTYLTISGADLAETAFTPTDENTAPAGVYHESIAAYTGVISAATAPTLSGNVAGTVATNQAATAVNQATVVDAHAVVDDLAAGVNNASFATPGDAAHASHNHTQDAHNHTQDSHTHAITGVTVSDTGEPRRLGVLRYFRR